MVKFYNDSNDLNQGIEAECTLFDFYDHNFVLNKKPLCT